MMKFSVCFYKNGKLFSMDVYKNVKNKKEAIKQAKEYAKIIGCEKYEVEKIR